MLHNSQELFLLFSYKLSKASFLLKNLDYMNVDRSNNTLFQL